MRDRAKWTDWVIVGLGLLLVARTAGNVWRLYKAGERVNDAQAELEEAKRANGELRQKLEEVNSPEFIEREAREKLGYGREGEVILLLPEEEGDQKEDWAGKENKPNWKKWWDLYVRL